jgi:hypothetical protein
MRRLFNPRAALNSPSKVIVVVPVSVNIRPPKTPKQARIHKSCGKANPNPDKAQTQRSRVPAGKNARYIRIKQTPAHIPFLWYNPKPRSDRFSQPRKECDGTNEGETWKPFLFPCEQNESIRGWETSSYVKLKGFEFAPNGRTSWTPRQTPSLLFTREGVYAIFAQTADALRTCKTLFQGGEAPTACTVYLDAVEEWWGRVREPTGRHVKVLS